MSEPNDLQGELVAAYAEVEDPGSFPDPASLESYRRGLLARTEHQAAFVAGHAIPSGRIVEIGCGNGRLLIELARRSAIERGLGLDVASSRIAFARQWAADEGLDSLHFAVGDALAYPLPRDHHGAALCITGAFAYFEPLAPGTALALARRLHDTLLPGGLLCLELYPHPEYRRLLEAAGGEARVWRELPAGDPWRFYLSRLSLDDSGGILTHEKTFVHRVDGRVDSGRRERLYLYTERSLRDVLTAAGFREIEAHEGWSRERYDGGEVMVATARK